MKKLVIVIVAFFAVLTANAQNTVLMDNFYAGFQLNDEFTAPGNQTLKTNQTGNIYLAADRDISVGYGKIYVMACYNNQSGNGPFTFVKWHRQLTETVEWNVGWMPTVIPFFTRVSPVHPQAHIENRALSITPGANLGTYINMNVDRYGSQIFLGAFYDKNYAVQFNIGVKMVGEDFNLVLTGMSGLFSRRDTLLGYSPELYHETTNHIGLTGALQLNYQDWLKFTLFGNQDETGDNTFSGYLEAKLKTWRPNVGFIWYENQNDLPGKENYLEFAIQKEFSKKLSFISPDAHLLISGGYQCLPYGAVTVKLQCYIF